MKALPLPSLSIMLQAKCACSALGQTDRHLEVEVGAERVGPECSLLQGLATMGGVAGHQGGVSYGSVVGCNTPLQGATRGVGREVWAMPAKCSTQPWGGVDPPCMVPVQQPVATCYIHPCWEHQNISGMVCGHRVPCGQLACGHALPTFPCPLLLRLPVAEYLPPMPHHSRGPQDVTQGAGMPHPTLHGCVWHVAGCVACGSVCICVWLGVWEWLWLWCWGYARDWTQSRAGGGRIVLDRWKVAAERGGSALFPPPAHHCWWALWYFFLYSCLGTWLSLFVQLDKKKICIPMKGFSQAWSSKRILWLLQYNETPFHNAMSKSCLLISQWCTIDWGKKEDWNRRTSIKVSEYTFLSLSCFALFLTLI